MLTGFVRKARRVAADPVLRRWLVERAIGRAPAPPAAAAHRPPYAADLLPLGRETANARFAEIPRKAPGAPLTLALAGTRVVLDPKDAGALFDRGRFDDLETWLAVQRFAWLPLADPDLEPAWVDALWRAWRERFGTPSADWPWHPYTAAERAINLLAYARRSGLPAPAGETAQALADHLLPIAERLEYFGEHDTSNHLSNDGRGLFLAGLALGCPRAADLGGRILVREAERLFLPSGLLCEGSSHYHLLLARNYAECWLAAKAAGRPEAAALARTLERAFGAARALGLPAGIPLIGDISPDCPPEFVASLIPGAPVSGWLATLDDEARRALVACRDGTSAPDAAVLAADGLVRHAVDPWTGLWYAAPSGWPPMPGHAHDDFGAGEVHWRDLCVLCDPGRGAYGEAGDAARYRGGAVHNALLVDGRHAYPANKPYYDAAFRARIAPPPAVQVVDDRIQFVYRGFRRLGGVGEARRTWRLEPGRLVIADEIAGTGRRQIERVLATPLAAAADGTGAVLSTGGARFRVRADAPIRIEPLMRWTAYGRAEPAHRLSIAAAVELPWRGEIVVEVA